MSAYLDLDDAAAPHPKAAKELAELRAELAALRAQEPVGEIVGTEKRGFAMMIAVRWEPGFNRTMPGTKLYAHPVPAATEPTPAAPAQQAADAQALRDAAVLARAALREAWCLIGPGSSSSGAIAKALNALDAAIGTDRSEAPK